MTRILQRQLNEHEQSTTTHCMGTDTNADYDQWLDCVPAEGESIDECVIALRAQYPDEIYRIVQVEESV